MSKKRPAVEDVFWFLFKNLLRDYILCGKMNIRSSVPCFCASLEVARLERETGQ